MAEVNTNPNPDPLSTINNEKTPEISPYEQSRQERIKANLERMQKLGIVDLSLKLKSLTTPKRTPRNSPSSQKHSSPLQPSGPLRRSSRLHNVTPVSYSEAALAKKDGLLGDDDVRIEAGSKPEVYTEEHEKLLGKTERSWTFFVDGYGSDGKRIYDQVKGKTCHQCRQKTLGHRTHCSKCQMVQGQFCGDCLYMRYGEHVLEAIENPNWICPACRGICNCSLCRQTKGWAPTGPLYRKISSLGYKSVAHYLIQTRRCPQNTTEEKLAIVSQVSAKRSLPFSDMETPAKRSPQINNEQSGPLLPQSEGTMLHELNSMKEKQLSNSGNMAADGQTKRSLPFTGNKRKSGNVDSIEISANCQVHVNLGLPEPMLEDQKECELQSVKDKQMPNGENLDIDGRTRRSLPLEPMFEDQKESELKSEEDRQLFNNGSVAADGQTNRSMLVSESEEKCEIVESAKANCEVCDFGLPKCVFEDKRGINEFKDEEEKQLQSTDKAHGDSNIATETCQIRKKKCALAFEPSPDSIGGRLRLRRQETDHYGSAELTDTNVKLSDVEQSVKNYLSDKKREVAEELQVKDDKHADKVAASDRRPMLKKKSASTSEPNPDGIGGRLRQKRRMSEGYDEEVPEANDQSSDGVQAFNNISIIEGADINKELLSTAEPLADSIARRLRSRQKLI